MKYYTEANYLRNPSVNPQFLQGGIIIFFTCKQQTPTMNMGGAAFYPFPAPPRYFCPFPMEMGLLWDPFWLGLVTLGRPCLQPCCSACMPHPDTPDTIHSSFKCQDFLTGGLWEPCLPPSSVSTCALPGVPLYGDSPTWQPRIFLSSASSMHLSLSS